MEDSLDRKNLLVMKLLHYFITEMNYNPIILQGAQDEIWLENLESDYRIVRIVSGYIHNAEQMDFDLFKTKRVLSKIKRKTFSFQMNVLSIYTDLGDNASLQDDKHIHSIYLYDETDLKKYPEVVGTFKGIDKKLNFSEEGLQLFLKITDDINQKNQVDAKKVDEIFKPKEPIVTRALILLNVVIYLLCVFVGDFDTNLSNYCVYGPLIRMGEYYRLITGTFLHANLFHLLMNMYALYIIGSQIESFMGRTKYLAIYLYSGLMSSLLSITLGNYPSVGASGAIFGLMGCLLYFGYHYRVYLGNVLKSQIIPLILLNLVVGFLVPDIDNFAHIGGLIGGLLITVALGVKYKSTTFEKINGWIVTLIFTFFLFYLGVLFVR